MAPKFYFSFFEIQYNKYDLLDNYISICIHYEDIIANILQIENKIYRFANKIEITECKSMGGNFIFKNNKIYRINIRTPLQHVNIINNNIELSITESIDDNIYSSNSQDILVYGFKRSTDFVYIINNIVTCFRMNKLYN